MNPWRFISWKLAFSTLSLVTLTAQTRAQVFTAQAVGSPGVRDGHYYALVVGTNTVMLTGTNTLPNSARIVVDGSETSFNREQGTWAKVQTLRPGANRLLIEVFDPGGGQLLATNKLLVAELASLSVGGSVVSDTTWTNEMGIIHVTEDISIGTNATLNIGPGSVVLLRAGLSIRATAGGGLNVMGSPDAPVTFLPEDGITAWGELAADGTNSFFTLRHAETVGGAVAFWNGALGLMEDSYLHENKSLITPIAGSTNAKEVTVRRCHFRQYFEVAWHFTPVTVEDSLFEWADELGADALEFDGVPSGSLLRIRRCTFRHGPQRNSDGCDVDSASPGTVIEDCLIYDFPTDKGVSIGEGSYGIEVTNCLMYGLNAGIAVKDSGTNTPCTAVVRNCTITDCDFGFRGYNKSDSLSP